MHSHEPPAWLEGLAALADAMSVVFVVGVLALVLFFVGVLPIPVGYERGKIAWVVWCGTGMHAHVVYWTDDHGFQTLHPADRSGGELR